MIDKTIKINGIAVKLIFAPMPNNEASEQAFEILADVLSKGYRFDKCI